MRSNLTENKSSYVITNQLSTSYSLRFYSFLKVIFFVAFLFITPHTKVFRSKLGKTISLMLIIQTLLTFRLAGNTWLEHPPRSQRPAWVQFPDRVRLGWT